MNQSLVLFGINRPSFLELDVIEFSFDGIELEFKGPDGNTMASDNIVNRM